MATEDSVLAFMQEPDTETGKITHAAEDTASLHLEKLFSDMFNNVDAFLLKQENMSDHNLQKYSHALRGLYLKQDTIEAIFFAELSKYYVTSISHQANKALTIEDASNLLLNAQSEQLEESIAIANMIAKTHKLYHEPLSMIEKRFNAYLPHNIINKHNIPFGPEQICKAIRKSVLSLNIPLELTLGIYKLFEQSVILNLSNLYLDINTILVNEGLLPNLIPEPGITPITDFRTINYQDNIEPIEQINNESQPQSKQTPLSTPVTAKVSEDLFGTLQHLVVMKRHMETVAKRQSGTTSNKKSFMDVKNKKVLTSNELTVSLVSLQIASYDDLVSNNLFSKKSARLSTEYIKNFILEYHSVQKNIISRKLEQDHEDSIDLVCLVFEAIKIDRSLPSDMKKIILKLKLPIIKIAVADKAFFNDVNHSARKLMNLLATGAISWNEMSDIDQDPLYNKANFIVDRILGETLSDITVFSESYKDLSHFLEDDSNSNESGNQPSTMSIDTVDAEISNHMANNELPDTIKHFLMTAWHQVLTHIASRYTKSSNEWKHAQRITLGLISSSQPKITQKEKQSLLKDIPEILNGLQDGLTLISYNRGKLQQFFTELELIHMASLKGKLIDIYDLSTDCGSIAVEFEEPDYVLNPEKLINEINEVTTRIENRKNLVTGELGVYKETIENIGVGTWLEFIEKNSKKYRARLAWKSESSGEYSFVDRHGSVITDKSLSELAENFRDGHIHVINDTPLMDRVLEEVRCQLKKFVYETSK